MIKTRQNPLIAVVVPFYKIIYFEELLDALAKQTDKKFNVYIGDDCSLDNPTFLLEKYKNKLNIIYNRFEQRLGHISLTKQWERCLSLSKNEEWIWFLPDDDLPSINVVEEFYCATERVEENVNVIRLPMEIIDCKGRLIQKAGNNPLIENNYQFYMRQLKGEGGGASLGDNIFRRSAFEKSGGFIDFPKAWGSDHATVLNVASGGVIYCLQRVSLGFRMSSENISADTSDGEIKIKARLSFVEWIKQNEDIFPAKPDPDFYKFFYFKGEHYVLHEWPFNLQIWIDLYSLRRICLNSKNPFPLLKLLLMKIQKYLIKSHVDG